MKKGQLIKKNILEDILRENGGWMKSSEIEYIVGNILNVKICKSTIRRFYFQINDIVIFNSASNEYMLSEFASQDEIKKYSNINKLIFDYLNYYNTPKHINEILENVRQYKPQTNKNVIRNSLIYSRFKTIDFYENNLYGISSKKYSEESVFKKNTIPRIKTNITKLIYNFLIDKNEPKHVNEIIEKLKLVDPSLKRSSILANLHINKTRLYKSYPKRYFGLKSKEYSENWNEIDKSIKVQTIKYLVSEYLENENLPKHITEISNYVIKFRPELSKTNIYASITAEKYNPIISFNNSYFGLKSKQYPSIFIKFDKKRRINIIDKIIKYLQNEANPKHISDIQKYISDNFNVKNYKSIRQIFIKNNKNRFVRYENKLIGLASKKYSSKYKIKKKEIKTSIIQLIYDYLEKQETPVHIDAIVAYIMQYKPYTNKHSILNIINDYDTYRFSYFNNQNFGISEKEYPKEFIIETKILRINIISIKNKINAFLLNEKYPVSKNTIIDYILKENQNIIEASVINR